MRAELLVQETFSRAISTPGIILVSDTSYVPMRNWSCPVAETGSSLKLGRVVELVIGGQIVMSLSSGNTRK